MLSSHYLVTVFSSKCVQDLPVYPQHVNGIKIVTRLLGKWHKLDCGKLKIQPSLQAGLEKLKEVRMMTEFDFMPFCHIKTF